MKSSLQTVVPCVHYDDFLALTLPHNLPYLESVTVLTSPRDRATSELAKQLGVELFATDAWHTGGPLNKALALNEWVAHITAKHPDAWLLSLDADTLLFHAVAPLLPGLDPTCLYGARRRLCDNPSHLAQFLAGQRKLSEFPLEPLPMVNLRLEEGGAEVAANPAALSGYFQLWHAATGTPKYFPETGTAQMYDVLFGLQFPEASRRLLTHEALHIGPTRVNWSGRQSKRWV